jgi:hypothetical protein
MNLKSLVIVVFWGIVISTHVYLMVRYYLWSKHNFEALPKRGQIGKIMGLSIGVQDTVNDINDFVSRFNKHDHDTNIAHFWGYSAGLSVAIVALILEIQNL